MATQNSIGVGVVPGNNNTYTFPNASGTLAFIRSILAISTTTTGATLIATDYVYLCTGTFTYTQPTAVSNTNRYTIKNAGTGTITIDFISGQTADGNSTIELTQNQSVELISNNTNYNII